MTDLRIDLPMTGKFPFFSGIKLYGELCVGKASSCHECYASAFNLEGECSARSCPSKVLCVAAPSGLRSTCST